MRYAGLVVLIVIVIVGFVIAWAADDMRNDMNDE